MSQPKSAFYLPACAVLLLVAGCSSSSSDPAGVTHVGGTTAEGGTSMNGGGTDSNGGRGGSTSGGVANGGAGSLGGNANGTLETGGNAAGGSTTGGGVSFGGSAIGGKTGNAIGGSTVGGAASVGGATTGGKAAGGQASGGTASGGSARGGSAAGGRAAGGASSVGGSSAGGTTTGGGTGIGGAAIGGASSSAGGSSAITLPAPNASFDYQIGGAYAPPTGVKVVSRDRNSAPAAGLYNICYVNGFQVQPDEESFWTGQHPTLVLRDASGNPVVDVDWDEMLLDTSTASKRAELATIIGSWITKCKTDGFNAVEIDNLDSYSRSTGLLTQANNIAFMTMLATTAHSQGLAIAQKNSSELLGSVSTMGTDFAVVEECNRYDECDTFKSAYGNLVFIIEYRAQDYQKGCSTYPELSIVLRDLNVSTPSSSSYVYQGC